MPRLLAAAMACLLILKDRGGECVHLQNGLVIRPAAPRSRERDVFPLIGDDGLAKNLLCQGGDEFFREDDQVLVVGIGHVELQHREFRVVNRRDALVPKVAVDFKHTRKSAHDQPLQIQFRRDAEIEIDAERIVVCDKGFRRRASGNRMHHRRFNLKEAAFDQEGANTRDDSASGGEDAMDFRVGD